MSDLAAIGEALTNVGGAINEVARHAGQNSKPAVEHFEEILAKEIQRLGTIGESGLAGALGHFRAPLSRLMKEGW